EDCSSEFTPQQVARMHCYLDLKYQTWQQEKRPSPVPLAPSIVTATNTSVTLSWVPPLGRGAMQPTAMCDDCIADDRLVQYATAATAPGSRDDGSFYSATQAVGPPDADACDASGRAWVAYPLDCGATGCTIELSFDVPVAPSTMTLWVTWYAKDGLRDVVLVYTDGSELSLGAVPVYCDMPYTASFDGILKKVTKLR
ncbi:PREDICTED: pappalysin-1-like, partial [Priapulus caudatus]|uniref:Pappalysin-1-like n=1 Tax=Priapulus caudatus TaxID=37621 RepID=A0ABM1F2B6_PRICU